MAINAIFRSDFSDFNKGVEDAEAKLNRFTISNAVAAKVLGQSQQSSKSASSGFSGLAQGLMTADKTLAAFGLHIGPQIHALSELGDAAGKTASQIGAIGTVSLVAAAALGGFELGKLIRSFTQADEAVSGFLDRLLHLRVAQEEAAAKQDSINRAIKDGAPSTISYADAVAYNTKSAQAHADVLQTEAVRFSNWRKELDGLRSSGTLDALDQQIKNHNSSVAQMSKEFKVTAETVQYRSRQLDLMAQAEEKAAAAAKKAADAFAEEQKKLAELVAQHQEEIGKVGAHLFGAEDIENAQNYAEAIGTVAEAERLVGVNAEAAKEAADALEQGEKALKAVGGEATDQYKNFEALRQKLNEVADAAKRMKDAFIGSGGTPEQFDAMQKGEVSGIGHSAMQPFVGLAPSVFSAGGVAGVNTPGTLQVSNTFNVNGTAEESARQIMDIMTRQLSIGQKVSVAR